MPGFNEQQATLISATDLATVLAGYSQDAAKIQADTYAKLAAVIAQGFKKPSIFRNGITSAAVASYTPQGSDEATQLWFNLYGFVPTVKVFALDAADIIRVRFNIGSNSSGFFPAVIGFMLSPSDVFNPICLDQAATLGQISLPATYDNAFSGNPYIGSQLIWEDIPCAGNKYIHIFGSTPNGNSDVWSGGANSFGINTFSFSLLK